MKITSTITLAKFSDGSIRQIGKFNRVESVLISPDVWNTVTTANERARVTAKDVVRTICAYFKMPQADVKRKCRKAEVIRLKQFCRYFLIRKTNLTLEQIGERTGGVDHSTVISSRERLHDLIATEYDTQGYYIELCGLLDAYPDFKREINKPEPKEEKQALVRPPAIYSNRSAMSIANNSHLKQAQ